MLDATTDAAAIVLWWRRHPDANLGVATGAVSGLLVLDIDVRHGGKDAVVALQRRHERFPETLTSQTGGGGWHVFFRHPGGKIPCSTGRIGPGLDVKGDGGSITLPPSIHASGMQYAWLDASVPVADAPAWFAELVRPAPVPTVAPVASPEIASVSGYGRRALEGEAAVVRATPEGGRNHALNRAAFKLGQLVEAGALRCDDVIAVLLAAALTAGLTEAEAAPTIRGGLRAGMSKPRVLALYEGRR